MNGVEVDLFIDLYRMAVTLRLEKSEERKL